MSRPLSDRARAECAKTATAPINILKVAFGAPIGDRFYSDRDLGTADGLTPLNAQGRVVSWGRISLVIAEQTAAAVGDCTVELADADGVLRGYFSSVELQRKRVCIYQHFADLAESDVVPLLVGMINAPVRWLEASGTLAFDVTDISTFHRATLGQVADRDTFPSVAERDENRVLPLVFGRVARVPAVQTLAGASTVLLRACTPTDQRLLVADASRFPQRKTITIRIEKELIEGEFRGNSFYVNRRGVDLVPSSTVTRAGNVYQFADESLPGEENEYAGFYVRVTDPGGTTHHRLIQFYSAELHRISYTPPIRYLSEQWRIPAGTTYAITSWARSHLAGAAVREVQAGYIYILNDAPSRAVHRIEGYGRVLADTDLTNDQKEILDVEGYVPIDPNDYTVNLNDTTSFPQLGHAVTTARFRLSPKELYPRLRSDALWADVEGVESAGDGTGSLVENPAHVIRAILLRRLGLSEADLDGESFDRAADELAGFRMAFALCRQADALHLCADLAFQARCALLWEDGRARLLVLRNRVGEPVLTLGLDDIAAETLRRSRTDLRELASEIVALYGSEPDRPSVVVRDAAVEAAHGRRVRQIDLWAYQDRRMAVSIARFWLERWKYLYEEVRLAAFLSALQIQRNDTVALDIPGHFPPSMRGTVREIHHQPGHGGAGLPDSIRIALRLPVEAGCLSACETECESGGESGCLLQCEVEAESGCWQCETQCESLCELACTTEAELHCVVTDTFGISGGGCGACETGCEAACQTSCQSGCETSCELGCEIACQSGCEITCEITTEPWACESGCEAICETGCETACESACESLCESSCETTCEAMCESACESGCETSCETGCETGGEVGGALVCCDPDCQCAEAGWGTYTPYPACGPTGSAGDCSRGFADPVGPCACYYNEVADSSPCIYGEDCPDGDQWLCDPEQGSPEWCAKYELADSTCIPGTLTIRLSGLLGDFAPYNGDHEVTTWSPPGSVEYFWCKEWSSNPPIYLKFELNSINRNIILQVGSKWVRWDYEDQNQEYECTPWLCPFTLTACYDGYYQSPCQTQSGATAEILEP